MKVYMDNGATTCMSKEAIKEMLPFFDKRYGNASSLHEQGLEAHEALDEARETIAKCINASPEELVFCSGGTESDNIAIFGAVHALKSKGNHIITTRVEHPAVLNCFQRLEKEGFKVDYLPVDKEGFVDIAKFEKKLTPKTTFVSVMHANNEIGTIYDIGKIGAICRKKKILFHSDACQSFTKVPIDVKAMNVDLLTLNGHKIHGPKGIGALYIRKGIKIEKMTEGGPHEMNMRPGTENIPAIVGFAKAAKQGVKDMDKNVKLMHKLQKKLADGLLSIQRTALNGPGVENTQGRLCNNVNIRFDYVEGEAILLRLSMEGIDVSTGSACSSKSLKPSHVLSAIGLKHEQSHGSIRFSLSKFNTEKEVDYVIKKTKKVIEDLRKISAFRPEKDSYAKLMKKGGKEL